MSRDAVGGIAGLRRRLSIWLRAQCPGDRRRPNQEVARSDDGASWSPVPTLSGMSLLTRAVRTLVSQPGHW